jgi:hypothetical protein
MEFFDTPAFNGKYDYNCDFVEEPKLALTCGANCSGELVEVPSELRPGCGGTWRHVKCKFPSVFGAPCAHELIGYETQACR